MSADVTDIQSAIDAGLMAAEPNALDPNDGRLYSVVIPAGANHKVIDVEDYLDKHRFRPRRKTGTVAVHNGESFVAYLGKHAEEETEVWADVTKQSVVAVINAHTGSADAGHGDHRARLVLTLTDAWKAWAKYDGQWLTQIDFAEHIEARTVDINTPSGAEMLEVATNFSAKRNLTFGQAQSLATGNIALTYHEETKETAGKKGQLEFPRNIVLFLIPFEGSAAYKVPARLRYRIADGALRIGYVLDRPSEVLALAFEDVVTVIEAGIQAPVFRGTPTAG